MWDLTIPGNHDFYVATTVADILVHNCAGPVTLSERQIDEHIIPRHGPGSPAIGTKLSDAIYPEEYESLANEAVRGNTVPTEFNPATGNHAHDFDLGRVIGENGETAIRVWVNGSREVQSMYLR
jgi:hypothetical protein